MHKVIILILLCSLIFFFAFCKSQQQQREDLTCNDLKSIKIGMTLDQVRAILGPPLKQDLKPDAGYWIYSSSETGNWIIKFRDGKVVDKTSLGMNCP